MGVARHVETTQTRKLIFFQHIKKKVVQLFLYSIVMKNTQIFYGGAAMFVDIGFWVVVVKNGAVFYVMEL